jgi:hypothetical protein
MMKSAYPDLPMSQMERIYKLAAIRTFWCVRTGFRSWARPYERSD